MPRRLFIMVLAIVVVPVAMTCWKIVQYSRASRTQVYDLHYHIAHTLALNTTAYFNQLNARLAFAPLLVRAATWSEKLLVVNNALSANSDFACVALLDDRGKEKVKAFDGGLSFFALPLDYAANPLFLKVLKGRMPDTGSVYEKAGYSFFDIIYPLESGQFLLVSVRWESLKNLLFDQQVGKNGFIWLLEESGRVVGDSHDKEVGKNFSHWSFFEDQLKDELEWRGEFADPLGVPMVGAGTWVKGAGWFVLSAQTQAEAYAKARQLRDSAFRWVVFSILGMVWFAYFWVKYISLPVTKLSIGVHQVAQRQFDQQVPEDFGLDEFRALGHAFNNMVKELKSYEALQVEKIIEQNTTVQSLLYSIRDGIVMVGENGDLLFTNEPARTWTLEVTGHAKSFEAGWDSLQQYPPWTDALQPLMENQKNSISEEFEFPVQGRSRWARVMAQQVLTGKGRRLGVMIVIRDITQDKELDRMKEDFFNGITHDLRTPLAATIGYLGLSEMQFTKPDEEIAKLVQSAHHSAKRALGLVETILSLARLQAGKLQINKVPVQAQVVLSKIAHEMLFFAKTKKIEISYYCDDASLWVSADPALIERVVENLTGNAIKYTMENGRVILRAGAIKDGVEFCVEDNGRGIPPEALRTLFGKFQQVKAEDRSVGFGIGLSFSKGIIEAHGSTIKVESQVGKGSKFSFVLQRVAAPAASLPTAA